MIRAIRWTLFLLLSSTFARAAPENCWWWNPDQGGSGFFFEVQGGQAFMAGYLYAPDGRATWLASNGPMPGENSYDGRLQSFANGQTLVGDYRAPAPSDAGPVSLRFRRLAPRDPHVGRHHGTDPALQL